MKPFRHLKKAPNTILMKLTLCKCPHSRFLYSSRRQTNAWSSPKYRSLSKMDYGKIKKNGVYIAVDGISEFHMDNHIKKRRENKQCKHKIIPFLSIEKIKK